MKTLSVWVVVCVLAGVLVGVVARGGVAWRGGPAGTGDGAGAGAVAPAVAATGGEGAAADAASRLVRPEAGVTAETLMEIVRALPEDRCGYRTPAGRAGLTATRDLIETRLRAMGYEPRRQEVIWRRRGEQKDGDGGGGGASVYHNVLVTITGAGTEAQRREMYVLGAHYDAVPGSPGADDNGSGTAALLEAARVLRNAPMRRTVELAFYTLEEVGLRGSAEHARSLAEAPEDERPVVRGMLSMDMLGYYRDEPGSQRTPFENMAGLPRPERGDFILLATTLAHRPFVRSLEAAMTAREGRVRIVTLDMLPIAPPDLLRSDHGPFLLRGIPGVIATDTANFRNEHYHRPGDRAETLDAERFAVTARAIIGAFHALAGPAGEGDVPAVDLNNLPSLLPGAGEGRGAGGAAGAGEK